MLAGMHPDMISEITASQEERPAKVKVSTVGREYPDFSGTCGLTVQESLQPI